MLFFYNKKMLGETLLITIKDSENVTYEDKKNITLIKDENGHLVGLNIFNVENLKLQGEGSIELTEENLGIYSSIELAQKILDMPLSRAFENILNEDLNEGDEE